MRLTFKRSNQQEADALRKLLDETVENEEVESRHNRSSKVPAFKTDASASFVEKDDSGMYGRKTEKEWQFIVTLEADMSQFKDGEGDGGLQSRIWSKLFAKLMQRPAIRAGTRVRGLPVIVTTEELNVMALKETAESVEIAIPTTEYSSRVASFFVNVLGHGYFRDNEGRRARNQETVNFEVTPASKEFNPEMWQIVVDCDAIDAPLVAEVVQEMLKKVHATIEYRAVQAAREAAKAK